MTVLLSIIGGVELRRWRDLFFYCLVDIFKIPESSLPLRSRKRRCKGETIVLRGSFIIM